MRIKVLCFCFMFFLCSCGFRPLYSSSNNITEQTSAVQIQPIAGEGGYQMGLILQEKLNPKQINQEKKYRLTVSIHKPVYTNQSIRSDNFASLENMEISASYQLVDLSNNQILVSSTVDANGLFNLINDPYATVVAQDKLYSNLIKLMADDIATHILSYFKGK